MHCRLHGPEKFWPSLFSTKKMSSFPDWIKTVVYGLFRLGDERELMEARQSIVNYQSNDTRTKWKIMISLSFHQFYSLIVLINLKLAKTRYEVAMVGLVPEKILKVIIPIRLTQDQFERFRASTLSPEDNFQSAIWRMT